MGIASRQVFGLAGFLLAPASQFMAEPVLMSERSFLFTAAGQFRILTGFPFNPELAIRHREVNPVYPASRGRVAGLCYGHGFPFKKPEGS
jgi:hypothetical protein